MKMVSAAKLRGVQRLLPAGRAWGLAINKFFKSGHTKDYPSKVDKVLLVPFSADRGLCGAINSSIARHCKSYLREPANADAKMFLFGDKARTALEREFGKSIALGITETNKRRPASFALCSLVAEQLLKIPADRYEFVFNKFISAISFKIDTLNIYSPQQMAAAENSNFYGWNFYGNKHELTKNLMEFRLASNFYALNIESSTAEQSSRMNAMDNSSKNASEMIDILRIRYNKARQGKITTELIEIVSGMSAME